MSEFIAEAEVQLRASSAKFLADITKAIKAAEKQTVTITVRATMAGFRADLNQKLDRSTRGLVVRPLVRADMRGFRTDLEAKVLRASKGVTATVGVKAGAVTQGAAAAATGGGVTTAGVVDRRAAAAQLAVNAAVASGVAARRRIADAMSDEERFTTRLEREQLHLKASTDAVNKAVVSGVPELLALAEAEERAARGALALSEAQAQRRALGVPIGVSTADFQAEAAERERLRQAETASIAAQDATRLAASQRIVDQQKEIRRLLVLDAKATDVAAAKFVKDEAKRVAAIEAETKALLKRATTAVSTARAADTARQLGPASQITRDRNAQGQFIAGGGVPIGNEAIARQQTALGIERQITAIDKELARGRRTAAGAIELADTAERKLAGTRSALRLVTDAALLAEENYTAALATQIPTVIEAAGAQAVLARQEQAALATTEASIAAEARRTGIITAGRRALVAQIANVTGLRGAALTAASGFVVASAAFIGLRKAIGIASDLEDELAVFNVTAGATASQMEAVHARAIELGKDITLPAVSASDAAVALTELSKAGLSVQDSMDGARGVLQLATAANIDFTQATNLTASALNAFGLAGESASHVADVLANSANESQGSITDAGVALQQSAAVARQAGLSLEQTVAALTLFARAGLRGSDAGTSLRTALIRLINPSNKAQEVINKLGLRLRTATGAIDLTVFQQFTNATRDLTAAQRDQALAIVFGQDAIRGAAILAREGTAGLSAEEDAIAKAGTAAEVAAARTSGLSGAIENLKNQLSTTGLVIGETMIPSLKILADTLADALAGANRLIEDLDKVAELGAKPIDIVVNFIEKKTGKDVVPGGKEKSLGTKIVSNTLFLAPAVVTNTAAVLGKVEDEFVRTFAEIQDLTGAKLVAFPTVTEARKELQQLLADVNQSKSPTALNLLIVRLQDIQKEMGDGTPKTKAYSEALQEFIDKAKEAAKLPTVPTIVPPAATNIPPPPGFGANRFQIPLPDSIVTLPRRLGKATSDAGQAAIDGLQNKLSGNELFGVVTNAFEKLTAAADTGGARFVHSGELTTKEFAAQVQSGLQSAFLLAVAAVNQGAQAMTDAMNTAILQGAGPSQIRTIIEGRLATVQAAIQRANARLASLPAGPSKARAKTKAVRSALLAEAVGLQGQRDAQTSEIESNAAKAAADRKAKAEKIQKANNDADQAFLDSLALGRTPLERKSARAAQTTGEDDNIAVLKAFRKRILAEQKAVSAGVKDATTKKKALQSLSDQLFQNGLDIAAARKTRDEAAAAALGTKGKALVDLGNTEGNTRLIIRGLNLQIADAKVVLAKAIQAKTGQLAAKAALAALKKQRADTVTEARNALLDQALALAEARGNKSQILQIIDLQIQQAKLEERQAKTLLDRLVAQTKIAELINKRKEVLQDEIEKGTKGTTAFDLLQQFSERFNDIAGNLINADQPFAGPTGFTADIAQFLKRRKGPGAAGVTSDFMTHDPNDLRFGQPKQKIDKQEATTNALIDALDKLTVAILSGSGNDTTGGKTTGTVKSTKGNPWAGRRWFVEAHAARGAQEG